MKVSSFGAARTVTGSCHILKEGDARIMVDCGLFQGHNMEEHNIDLGFDPAEISHVVLTHAHLDHCGRLPMLVKKGFKGKIFCTGPTYELARLILLDTAKIMLEDYNHALKKHFRSSSHNNHHNNFNQEVHSIHMNKKFSPPLYNELDVFSALDHFEPVLKYDESFPIDKKGGVSVRISDAGHILGSGFVKLSINGKSVIFSGDLGNKDKPILNNFSYPDDASAVYIETTYGDRLHKSFENSRAELLEIIKNTVENGGNVLIPSFAMERTQDLLFVLSKFYKSGELPKCKVFLDSPLAIGITDIFLKYPGYFKKELYEEFKSEDPFELPYLKKVRDIEDSKDINNISEGAVIIAGSGMLTGGRMIHHLKHNLWRKENAMVFIGYQAPGTLGREIVNGAESVRVFGESINVGARVYTLGGFSSHADRDELIDWLGPLINKGIKKVLLIHGETGKAEVFKEALHSKGVDSYIPSFGEEIEI